MSLLSTSFRLNRESQDAVLAATGMTVESIAAASLDEIKASLEKRAGKRFSDSTFSSITDQMGRGQVYPFAGRLITRDFIDASL